MIKAKSILKNKFWIVEDESEKIGTLCYDDERYTFTSGTTTRFYDSKKQINKLFGANIIWSESEPEKVDVDLDVNGFPTSVTPYNTMYDLRKKLPLFTKSKKSKSIYCAGYYIIRFDKGWVKSFCPKLITVERYEYKGPFKTELEMRQELSHANNK